MEDVYADFDDLYPEYIYIETRHTYVTQFINDIVRDKKNLLFFFFIENTQ